MIPDSYLAQQCANTYINGFQWDQVIAGQADDEIFIGIAHLIDTKIIVFRGSLTPLDWFRDIEGEPFDHPVLGPIEEGFGKGIDYAAERLLPILDTEFVLTGHSLGAAHATLVGALLSVAGKKPKSVCLLGAPKPGYAQLGKNFDCSTIQSYKNRYDPVCDLPVTFPAFPYVSIVQPILIDMPSKVKNPVFDPLGRHHVDLYQQGILALEKTVGTTPAVSSLTKT